MFRVLLPIDEDATKAMAAAEAVAALPCAATEVEAVLLNVQKRIDVTGGEGGSVDSEEWYDEHDLPDSVDEAAAYLETEGIQAEIRREHADPADEIARVAEEIGADRIVMSARKRSPVGKAVFGSVTQSVMLDSSIPVTVVFE